MIKKVYFKSRTVLLLLTGASLFWGTTIYAAGVVRNITSMEIVSDMKIGWNLGNTLDAWTTGVSGLNTETCWENPTTTKAMFDALKAKGFKTVRVPVTWNYHFGASPAYTIDKSWLDRVETVVKYGIDNDMYVILNMHHDDWITLTTSSQTSITDKITKIWAQIAGRFKDYSDYLIFETLNEPRLIGEATEWSGGTATARSIINAYNLAIVNTIRGSGGNNALRHIMIPTHAATSMAVAQDALVIPNNDKKIIISQHTYWPYNFTMNTNAASGATSAWGTASDKAACDTELDRIYNKFCKNGIPVIVGEWGTINKSNTAARAIHAEYYAGAVRKRGMLPVWWDNGDSKVNGFALLNRTAGSWYFPEIVDGLIKGSQVAVPVTRQFKEIAILNDLKVISNAVRYSLPKSSAVSLGLFDMQGKNVLNIVKYNQTAGNHETKLSSKGISSGNYILEFKTDNGFTTKIINLTK